MLPEHTTDLLDGFVKAFDLEHPTVTEFRRIRTQVRFQKGSMGWGGSDITAIGRRIAEFLETRAKFVWEKSQQIIVSTKVEFYPELSADLKAQLSKHFAPQREAAERFMEEIRREARAGSGYAVQTKAAMKNLLTKINAEIDLFCAAVSVDEKAVKEGGGPTFNNFTGIYGNVSHSQVAVNDYSSIHQLLVSCNIPKEARRELEDVLHELKAASPDHKPSLTARAEGWVVKHKETLGTTAEIVGKIITGSAPHAD